MLWLQREQDQDNDPDDQRRQHRNDRQRYSDTPAKYRRLPSAGRFRFLHTYKQNAGVNPGKNNYDKYFKAGKEQIVDQADSAPQVVARIIGENAAEHPLKT